MNDQTTGQQRETRFMPIRRVGEYLGVSPKTLYYWIKTHQIPYIRVGRLVFFDPREIEAWIDQHRIQSTPHTQPHIRPHHQE